MRKDTHVNRQKILFITQFSILLALEAIVCFTPLGSIPFGVIVATLAMVPVIITSVLLGVWAGTLMGFFAGLFSFIVWTFMPPNPAIAFVFTPFYEPGNFLSLLICFVPRILTGTFAGLFYNFAQRQFKNQRVRDVFQYGIAGIIGSMTNTILVLLGIILFFGKSYVEASEMEYALNIILTMAGITLVTNGVVEAIISFILVFAICKPLKTFILKTEEFV